jgi:hypothetical protein
VPDLVVEGGVPDLIVGGGVSGRGPLFEGVTRVVGLLFGSNPLGWNCFLRG